ncbi:MAG TPA: transglutaminase domain-containing protein [Fimbriimonadaceae bacterium]|nr:transglutaminase domain-containing protein [Fimbriimonadaceae bacterium]
MRTGRLLTALLLCVASMAFGQESWLGVYLQGQKVGYSSYKATPDTLEGAAVTRTESLTVFASKMLGSALDLRIVSTSWLDAKGRPVQMRFVTTSSGRTQTVDAKFGPQSIAVAIDNSGNRSTKTLPIPPGAEIVDDATAAFLAGDRPAVGTKRTFYVLDPTTVSLIKNEAVYRGPARVKVRSNQVEAIQVDLIDPRASTKLFVSDKGDVVKIEGPLGLEMYPETKEVAMAEAPADGPRPDLAFATAIPTEPPLGDPNRITKLDLEIAGIDLGRMPSDRHQTVRRTGDVWQVKIHPVIGNPKTSKTIDAAAKDQPNWIKPSMHMPSDKTVFKKLAATLIGKEKNTLRAARKIKEHVESIMRPNAGIGVLRDAQEVLKTKEGVCRDYAILTGTLLRAARIPTRLVSGLVSQDGKFYYHAWVEVYTGAQWVGLDSTRPANDLTATHIKLAEGSVEEAFQFFVLDGAKIRVLGSS